MKKILFLAVISLSLTAFAQEAKKKFSPPQGDALVGDTYGTNISAKTDKEAISTKKLAEELKRKDKVENISIKGKVVNVCRKKGCWLTLETDNNERFFVKMKDYAFFVPTAIKGKNIVLEGNAENKTISVEDAKHYAEDAKKSQTEINAITQPQKEIRFIATGIRVVK
ncbi:MAG: DUF4920 domain-containing protein [Flavobacteriales bacterium]